VLLDWFLKDPSRKKMWRYERFKQIFKFFLWESWKQFCKFSPKIQANPCGDGNRFAINF
jgi:hypothetical protein